MLNKNEKISNFYVLQALLKIEGIPDNEKKEFIAPLKDDMLKIIKKVL